MRRFLAHVAHKRRLDFVQLALCASEQFVQRRREILRRRARHFFQSRFDRGELVGEHRLEEIEFPGKMRVERFLADAELRRQVVHGHAAEAVTKKMGTRGGNDPLSMGVAAFARRPEATGLSHRDSFFTVETSIVYGVSTASKSSDASMLSAQ